MIGQSWAKDEFANLDMGDQRLNSRFINICDRFSESPESPINQACNNWAETKGAYRFFGNKKVDSDKILRTHSSQTAERSKKYKIILAVQDTSYLIYTKHRATKGIGNISMKKGKNIDKIFSKGLILHTCLAITTDGLPLGLLDQSITSRKPQTATRKKIKDVTPIEKKESYRWLKSLKNSATRVKGSQVVTVCDREADIYEFFHLSGEKALEWMLLTNLPLANLEQAYEKVKWYCLRWRIEMFFKVLKSGFNVENCRLGYANRLIKYLTVMTIIAWRLFMMTLIARSDPNMSCKGFLTDIEWKVLYLKTHKSKLPPKMPPKIKDVVRWIARLGGFLARKQDGHPGTIVIWRGWKRLNDLTQGWNLAIKCGTCG